MSFDYYRYLGPLLRRLSPEHAHAAAVFALAHGFVPPQENVVHPALPSRHWGLAFPNPVGLAAGFDKNAETLGDIFDQGFGFVEVGTVTPRPQPGNPSPRMFRLEDDEAVINRLGFNNHGMEAFVGRLRARDASRGVVGANIGKNKDSENAAADYVTLLAAVYPYADYVTVNISSPNTPGLRDLQSQNLLHDLLGALTEKRAALAQASLRRVPLLVKLAPDLEEAEIESIADAALALGADGLVISNTTVSRPPELRSAHKREQGGLSGRPLFAMSTQALRRAYRCTQGKIPLVGVGGIASGEDAYEKIRAGASLVQLYTALVYQGFGLVSRINRRLIELLARDGFTSVKEAVGADHA